jgi:hypothetical protein
VFGLANIGTKETNVIIQLFENDDRPLRKAEYVSRGETYGHEGVFFPIIPLNSGHQRAASNHAHKQLVTIIISRYMRLSIMGESKYKRRDVSWV